MFTIIFVIRNKLAGVWKHEMTNQVHLADSGPIKTLVCVMKDVLILVYDELLTEEGRIGFRNDKNLPTADCSPIGKVRTILILNRLKDF
jgi:hypothetical protein